MDLLAIFLGVLLFLFCVYRFFNGAWREGEPPLIKGWIPYLGVGLEYGKNPHEMLKTLSSKYGDIFTMVIAGKRMTFLTNPEDCDKVSRNSSATLDFAELSASVYRTVFRVPPSLTEKIFTAPGFHDFHRLYISGLQGHELEHLVLRINSSTKQFVAGVDTTQCGEDLCDFVCRCIFAGSGGAFFEDKIYNDSTYDMVVKLDRMFPSIFSGWPVRGATKLVTDMCATIGLNQANYSRFITKSENLIRGFNASPDNIIRVLLGVLWGAQTNTMPSGFWVLYYILRDEKVAEKVKQEIDSALGDKRDDITKEDLSKLVLLESCINEAIRLASATVSYRPAMSTHNITLPSGQEYSIRKGDLVCLYVTACHRDPEIFPDPDTFKMDRFLEQDGKAIRSFAPYFNPFGIGKPQCPGRYFAKNTIKLSIIHLLSNFDISFNRTTEVPIAAQVGFGMRHPTMKLPFTITRRKHQGLFSHEE